MNKKAKCNYAIMQKARCINFCFFMSLKKKVEPPFDQT